MSETIQFIAYSINAGEDESYQAYFLLLDLIEDTIDNVPTWDEFFESCKGKPLKVTVELEIKNE